jgi:hypothetical protein
MSRREIPDAVSVAAEQATCYERIFHESAGGRFRYRH